MTLDHVTSPIPSAPKPICGSSFWKLSGAIVTGADHVAAAAGPAPLAGAIVPSATVMGMSLRKLLACDGRMTAHFIEDR